MSTAPSDGLVCWCLMPWQQFESEGYAGSALNRLGGFVKLLGRGASYSDSFEPQSLRCVFAPKTCEQEEVREFKGVAFKIANYKPPFGRPRQSLQPCYASRPCTPRSTPVRHGVLRCVSPWRVYKPLQAAYCCHQYSSSKVQDVSSEFSHRLVWSIRSYPVPPRPLAAVCQEYWIHLYITDC